MGKNFKQVLVLVLAVFALLFVMFPATAHAAEGDVCPALNIEVYDIDGNIYEAGSVPEIEFVIRDLTGAEIAKVTTDKNGYLASTVELTPNQIYYIDVSDDSIMSGYFFHFENVESDVWNTGSALAIEYEKNSDNNVPGLMFVAAADKTISETLMVRKNEVIRITELSMPFTIEKLEKDNEGVRIQNAEFKLFKYFGNKNIFTSEIALINNEIYINGTKANASDYVLISEFKTDENGMHTNANVSTGQYILFETKEANGYFGIKDDDGNPIGIAVDLTQYIPDGAFISLTNEKQCEIHIIKVDENGNPMPNMEFTLQIWDVTNNGSEFVDYLTGLKTNAEGKLDITGLRSGIYAIVENVPEGYKQPQVVEVYLGAGYESSTTVTIENREIVFTATKLDVLGAPVAGVEFELYRINDDGSRTLYEQYTTDANGLIVHKNKMPAGNYVLVETKALTGTEIVDAYISYGTTTISGNEVSFRIYDNFESDRLELYVVNSVYEEPIAPTPTYSIVVNKHGQTITGIDSVYDEATGTYIYTFTTSNKMLAGSTFVLTAAEDIYDNESLIFAAGQVVKEFVTTGALEEITGLYPGTYTLEEVNAPDGYKVDTAPATIVITDKDEAVDVENFLHEVTFNVKKTDATTGNPIKGAVFGIFVTNDIYYGNDLILAKDSCIALLETDVNGFATSGAIVAPVGEYYVKEVKAATGYKLNTDTQTAVYYGTTQTISFEFTNEQLTGTIVIHKEGEVLDYATLANDNKIVWFMTELEGIEFTIYAEEDILAPDATQTVLYHKGDEVAKGKTNASGDIRFQHLPIGKYRVVETGLQSGYQTVEDAIVEVKESAETKVDFENYRIPLYATIKKTDISGNPLAGAKFGLYTKENIPGAMPGSVAINADTLIAEFTSDENGIVHIANMLLPYGEYVIKEISAPNGYLKTDETWTIKATDNDEDNVYSYQFTVVNNSYELTVEKVDTTDNNPIVGAHLVLYKGIDVYAEWISDGTPKVIKAEPGSYKLVETKAPFGYEVASPIEFTIGQTELQKSVVMGDDRATATVNITKYEAGSENKPVANVKYTLRNKTTGEIIATGTTNSEGKLVFSDITLGIFEGGAFKESYEFTLEETDAPTGYIKTAPVDFVIEMTNNGFVKDFVVYNEFTSLQINKFDEDGETPLVGAHFELIDAEGNVVAKWDDDDKSTYTITHLAPGTYRLVETKAPNGYLVATEREVVITESAETVVVNVTNIMDNYDITIVKTDAEGNILPGAKLELRDASGKVVTTWTSDTKAHVIKDLAPGTYTIVEVEAPAGYAKGDNINFTLKAGGTETNLNFEVVNNKITVSISKLEKGSGHFVSGAKLHLENEAGETVYSWTSGNDAHDVSIIIPAGKYYIVEDEAPAGYLPLGKKIEITVEETDTHQNFTVENDYTKLYINKLEVNTTNKFIDGAKMELHDANGNVVATWTTGNEAYYIEYLPAGEYTLVEIEAPSGHVIAEPVTFTLEATGDVQYVTMYDDYTKVYINKYEVGTEKFVVGTKLHIEDSKGNIVASWTVGDEAYYITHLPAGEYKLVEDKAADGYVVADAITFTVKAIAEKQEVTMYNDFTKVEINKFVAGTTNYVVGAKMHLEDAQGNIIVRWVSDGKAFEIDRLIYGQKYTIVEDEAPAGYIVAEPVTFTVGANDGAQVVNVYDDYTKVHFIKSEIGKEGYLAGAKLAVKDADGNIVAEWTSKDEAYVINALAPGKYTLVELEAPNGFYLAEGVEFTVTATAEVQKVVMTNEYTRVYIEKLEIGTTGTFVEGAKMHLEDAQGNIITSWTTGNEAFYIEYLVPGTYKIVEDEAPAGYVAAEPVTITVEATHQKQTFTMYDDYTKVYINKYEVGTEKFVVGTKLHIEDSKGNIVASWTVGDEAYYITHLPAGEYKLVEDKAADGYVVADAITFTVKAIAEKQEVTMYNDFTKVEINKFETGTTDKFVVGAKMHLEDADGNVIVRWTSDGKAFKFDHLLIGQEYVIVEDEAPAGYIVSAPVKFTVKDTADVQVIDMFDNYTKVQFHKYTVGTSTYLPGAELKLLDSDGKVIAQWTTNDTYKEITHLPAGEYTLVEVNAPNGYFTAKETKFTVKDTADIQTVTLYNEYTRVNISKLEEGTKKFVEGAKLCLMDADGKIVASWTAGDKAFYIEKLAPGAYIIVEQEAPAGYVKTEPVEIFIEATYDVQAFEIYNDYTKVYINKFEVGTEKFVVGSKLHIEDADGNIVASWTVGNEAHYITHLPAGEYKLVEDKAADGYVVAEPITFVVKETAEAQTFTMYDDFIKVSISKVEKGTSKFVVGAKLHIEDEAGNVIARWTSEDKAYDITHLLTGKYYIVEDEVPSGYVKAEKVLIIVTETGNVQKFVMEDDYTKLEISKLELGTTDKFVVGAKMHIEDADGNIIAEWVTTDAPYVISHLLTGKYKLVEDAAPEGYLVAEPVEFEVKATGEVQKVEMFDDYTKVAIAKLEKDTDKFVVGAKMHLEDAEGNIVAEWVTTDTPYIISHLLTGKYKLVEDAAPEGYLVAEPIEIEVTEDGELQLFKMFDSVKEEASGDSENPDNPQTGDSSNLGLYFGLMFTSLAGIIALTMSKKRRNF